jgi:hypothetical protein
MPDFFVQGKLRRESPSRSRGTFPLRQYPQYCGLDHVDHCEAVAASQWGAETRNHTQHSVLQGPAALDRCVVEATLSSLHAAWLDRHGTRRDGLRQTSPSCRTC